MNLRTTILCAALLGSGTVSAAEGDNVSGTLEGDGISGEVIMVETASGTVHVDISGQGVPEGAHGLHLHEVGKCESGDGFESAGGHVSAGLDHGIQSATGPHPGDLPNVHASAKGEVRAEFFVRGFTLGTTGNQRVMDDDGTSLILHSGPDDYETQPSGASGDRIACAVLKAAQ